MKLKPQNTYKHLRKFVAKTEHSPMLKCFHVTSNGDLEATNSHILLKLYNRFKAGCECIIEPNELRCIDGNYPRTGHLIPATFSTDFDLNHDQLVQIFNFSKSLIKEEIVSFLIESDRLLLTSSTGLNIELSIKSDGDFFINLRAEYIKIVFDFLKDNSELVTVGFNGTDRPIVFTDGEDYDALIVPVRVKS